MKKLLKLVIVLFVSAGFLLGVFVTQSPAPLVTKFYCTGGCGKEQGKCSASCIKKCDGG